MKAYNPYQPPEPNFQPGDRVKFNGRTYTVTASTHTHTQLKDLRWAIPNWQLRRVRKNQEMQP